VMRTSIDPGSSLTPVIALSSESSEFRLAVSAHASP
jgi:hypothetical protein